MALEEAGGGAVGEGRPSDVMLGDEEKERYGRGLVV